MNIVEGIVFYLLNFFLLCIGDLYFKKYLEKLRFGRRKIGKFEISIEICFFVCLNFNVIWEFEL